MARPVKKGQSRRLGTEEEEEEHDDDDEDEEEDEEEEEGFMWQPVSLKAGQQTAIPIRGQG